MATGGFIGFVGTIYITLLEVMAQYGCKNLVFSSSATMYDSPKEVAYTEESPISALNPYSLKKSAVMYTVLIRNGRSYCLNGVGVLIGEVDEDGKIVVDETPARLKALTVSLKAPKLAGVHGITVEVWWGNCRAFLSS